MFVNYSGHLEKQAVLEEGKDFIKRAFPGFQIQLKFSHGFGIQKRREYVYLLERKKFFQIMTFMVYERYVNTSTRKLSFCL